MNLAHSAYATGPLLNQGQGALSQGSFNFSSISPATGFSAPGGIAADFLNANPTEIGLGANKSVPYHFLVKEAPLTLISNGALVFGMQDNVHATLMLARDLLMVNKYFETRSVKDELLHKTAEEVADLWRFIGVAKARMQGTARRGPGTCLLNNTVGSRASAVNVWGENAQAGTQLYIVVKQLQDGTWKYFAHARPAEQYPSLACLRYRSKHSISYELGCAIHIGTAISAPTACVEGADYDFTVNPFFAGGVDVAVRV